MDVEDYFGKEQLLLDMGENGSPALHQNDDVFKVNVYFGSSKWIYSARNMQQEQRAEASTKI